MAAAWRRAASVRAAPPSIFDSRSPRYCGEWLVGPRAGTPAPWQPAKFPRSGCSGNGNGMSVFMTEGAASPSDSPIDDGEGARCQRS